MPEIAHRFVTTNGIKMHYVEAGSGPRVMLCHGHPECWYSWRHQIRALAEAGFHTVAPDMRGYGQTEQPKEVEAYDIFQLTGDLVGLVNALGGEPVVIVGHDWGAWVTQFVALFRPDLFRAVALLSVPSAVVDQPERVGAAEVSRQDLLSADVTLAWIRKDLRG